MNTEPTPEAADFVAEGRKDGPFLAYASAAYYALPKGHPRRLWAMAVYAEAWRDEKSPERIRERIREQLADEDRAAVARLRALSADVASARSSWTAEAERPSWAELVERRAA